MADDIAKLVVSMEANLKNYLQGLAKAQGTTASALKKIETQSAASMGRVEKSFAKAGSALAGFGKGLVIGGIFAAVAGIEQLITGAVSSAAAIGDLSQKLGITSDKLQELQFGAVQANMSFDELETSLLKFSKTLGQARNGQGDLLKTLEANGFDKAKIKALSYSDALDVVADLVENAANEQDALLIITQAFGKGGDEMLEFLRNGSGGLREFGDAAHRADAIIKNELIKTAQEFDDMWARAMRSAASQTQTFVLNTISELEKIKGLWERITESLDGVDFNQGGGRYGMSRPGGKRTAPPVQTGDIFSEAGNVGGRNYTFKPSPATKLFDPEKAKADADPFTKAQQQKSDAIKRLIDFSIEQQGRAADAAEEQLALDRELYDSKLALAEAAYSAFEAIAIGGEKASDVIKDLAQSLLKAAVQASLFGSGPLASLFGTASGGGIFGSLFGKPAGRAGGGHVNAGQPYIVGERRPEVFVPSQSGSIVPRVGGGGSHVQIIDQRRAGEPVQPQRGSDGTMRFFIRDAVNDIIGSGQANKSMRGQFGIAPQKARR